MASRVESSGREVTPAISLGSDYSASHAQDENLWLDGAEEEQKTVPETNGYQHSEQYPSYGQSLGRLPTSEADPPSSESDFTYRPSSLLMQTSSPADFLCGSSPPTVRRRGYKDQAEDGTNAMMCALLINLCEVLSRHPTSIAKETAFRADPDVEPLLIPTGDGAFSKTIPDLKVLVQREGCWMMILDYEVSSYAFIHQKKN